MESSVTLKVAISGGETKTLDKIPLTYPELVRPIATSSPTISRVTITCKGAEIKDTMSMVKAFMSCREDELVFDVDVEEKLMSYMDAAVQDQYNSMVSKFRNMVQTPKEESIESSEELVPMINGVITKDGLLTVIKAMADAARDSVLENSRKFLEKRQEFYNIDEEKYREVVMQQLQFNDMLIMSVTSDTCQKYNITPTQFDQAAQMYAQDPEIRIALESLAVEQLQGQGEMPAELTKIKLREILCCSCDFIEKYIDENPKINPMEVVILKMREADEIFKMFGFDELAIAAAINTWELETSPDFEDLRARLNTVTEKLFQRPPEAGPPEETKTPPSN